MSVPPSKPFLYSDSYGWLVVRAPLGQGGESTVYDVKIKNRRGVWPRRGFPLVAAVHLPEKRPRHLEFLVRTISESLEGLDSVAAPLGVVRESPGGEPVGFLMRRVRGWRLDEVNFHGVGSRVRFARSLAQVVAGLEDHGLIWSDAKPDNVFWTPPGRAVLIDALSFSIPNAVTWPDGILAPRHTVMGDELWYAPENLGIPREEIAHTPASAAWGLSCVLHYALKDEHPARMLTADGVPLPLADCLRGGDFGRFSQNPPSNRTPADFGIPYEKLHNEVRWYFDMTFRFGRTDPTQRPSARMWADALGRWSARRRANGLGLAACGLGGSAIVAAAAAVSNSPRPAPPTPAVAETAVVVERRAIHRGSRPALWNSLQDK